MLQFSKTIEEAVANHSEAMVARNHFKNEASMKSKRGRGIFISGTTKNFCKIVISLCFIFYTCVTFGQVVPVNNKNIYSQGISLVHAINLMNDDSSPLYEPLSYFDGENFVSHRFSVMGNNATQFGRTDTLSFHFFKSTLTYQLAIKIDGTDYMLEWNNDNISGIQINHKSYRVVFDDQNRVVSLYSYFVRNANNNMTRPVYNFFYAEDGKISKVERLYEIANSKEKVKYAGKYFTTTYNYISDQEVIVTSERYAETSSSKTNVVNYAYTTHYRLVPGKLNIERQIIVREENRKPTIVTEDNPTITELEFVQHNLTKQKTYTKQSPLQYSTSNFEYNDRGYCVKKEDINNQQNYKTHSICTFTYELKTGADPEQKSSYTVSSFMQCFNEAGEVYEESRDNKFRKKDENGNWSEWRFYRM